MEELNNYLNNKLTPDLCLNFINWIVYDENNNSKMSYIPGPNSSIKINLFTLSAKKSKRLIDYEIHKEEFISALFHEWVHLKQNLQKYNSTHSYINISALYKDNKGKNKRYLEVPEEQMAFAREEIEWLKQKLKKTKPHEILSWIKRWGLVSSERLQNLKRKDPKSYNRILKYIVLFSLRRQLEKKPESKRY